MADVQDQHHDQYGGCREDGFEGGPQHFSQQHIVKANRRVHDAVPGFLHMHARKSRIQRFEGGGIHGAHAHRAAGQKQNIGYFFVALLHTAHQCAQAIAKSHQPHQGLGNIGNQAGNKEFAPDQKITQKDRPKPQLHHPSSRICRPVSLRNRSSKLAGRCRVRKPGMSPKAFSKGAAVSL